MTPTPPGTSGELSIADLEKAAAEGKHIDIAPNGDVTVSDTKPRPTIAELLAQIDCEPRTPERKEAPDEAECVCGARSPAFCTFNAMPHDCIYKLRVSCGDACAKAYNQAMRNREDIWDAVACAALNTIRPHLAPGTEVLDALEFYAAESTYDIINSFDRLTGVTHRGKPIMFDGGEKARAILKARGR